MGAIGCRRPISHGWHSVRPASTPAMWAACRACRRGANCTPGATTSCTAAGARWNHLTTLRAEILQRHGIHTHPGHRPLPLLGRRRRHLPHTRYGSFETSRGQEGDLWKADLRPFELPESLNNRGNNRQDWVNRRYQAQEAQMAQPVTFGMGRGVPAHQQPARTTGSCTWKPSTRMNPITLPSASASCIRQQRMAFISTGRVTAA